MKLYNNEPSTPIDFIPKRDGSLKDRSLVPKGNVMLEDIHPTLLEMLFIKGKITPDMIDEVFKDQLLLSGEVTYEDLSEEGRKAFARKGYIEFEDLSATLREKLLRSNIKEQQLAPELLDKINSYYNKTIELIDCGFFVENTEDEEFVFDGGEW